MKILAVSDVELDLIYSPMIISRFNDVDLVISCGDLPFYYIEYIVSMLNCPVYYVRGNHAPKYVEEGVAGNRSFPWGAVDLHRGVRRDSSGLILAGIEGSVRYNLGHCQYSQSEMWGFVFGLVPKLILNKMVHGRFLDVFVSHAPPWRIHDQEDLPHQGIKAFNWLAKVFRPAFHLHGHIHLVNTLLPVKTQVGHTLVINTYGYQRIDHQFPWENND